MREPELLRAVARATGESVTRLRRIGFTLVEMPEPCSYLHPEVHLARVGNRPARSTGERQLIALPKCSPA
jgi:hypothetical protein